MSWLSEAINDAVDWIEEQFDWGKATATGVFNQAVKQLRIAWQNRANKLINEAEEKMAEEAVALMRDELPKLVTRLGQIALIDHDIIERMLSVLYDIPDDVLDQTTRKIYWKYLGYIRDKFDADWLIDT